MQKGVDLPSPRFTDNSDGTVTDNLTGLIWLKNANCANATKNWSDALTFANTLFDGSTSHNSGDCGLSDNSSAGDWRLPNRFELKSLINLGYFNPALSNTAGTAKWTEENPFTGVQSNSYWSSSTVSSNAAFGWNVHLNYGNVDVSFKTNSFFVWPVRGGQ